MAYYNIIREERIFGTFRSDGSPKDKQFDYLVLVSLRFLTGELQYR